MLLICKTCTGNVSSNAEICPHCGENNYRRDVYCDLCNGSGEYTDKAYNDGGKSTIYETITIRCPGCWGKGVMVEGYSKLSYKPGAYDSIIGQYLIRAQKKGNKKAVILIDCPRCKGYGEVTTLHTKIGSSPVNGNNHNRRNTFTKKYVTMHCPDCMESGLALPPEPKGCFITTAVCTFQNKADDCYELEILRRFRDEYLIKKYSNEIIKYYETSPKIVDLINESNQKKEIYRDIRKEIDKCIYFIENEEYEMAFEVYGKMFLKLKIDLGYLKN